ncbi:MAG: hypothetical protein MI741_09540, partial [Rhodospirillales bacterium]|nr:hypothetical protein [Rhodospirillales bacterium]
TAATNVAERASNAIPAGFAFLSQAELLKWSEQITAGATTVYDKALDAEYLRTHIGGASHRMFDSGHDIWNAFHAARNAVPDDAFHTELLGYMSALWKDVTTVKGLPFFTWSKDQFDASASWVATHVPGANREWFYDLMSFDAFEVLSSSLGVAGAIFCLRKEDTEKLAEILGAAGVTSVIAANPLGGIAMVFVAAYAYAVKKKQFNKVAFARGAGLSAFSIAVMAVLGLPVLIELGLLIVLTGLARKHVLDNQALAELMKKQAQLIREHMGECTAGWRVSIRRVDQPIVETVDLPAMLPAAESLDPQLPLAPPGRRNFDDT